MSITDTLEYACAREFLQEGPAFQFAVALNDDPAARAAALTALVVDLKAAGLRLATVDLADHPGRIDLLTILKEVMAAETPDAITLIGIEPHLPHLPAADLRDATGRADTAADPTGFLANTNWQRDAYPTFCPRPVLIWAPSSAVPAFANLAPDLWHWRAATFDFTGGPDENDTPSP